jgi:hypothetical protein
MFMLSIGRGRAPVRRGDVRLTRTAHSDSMKLCAEKPRAAQTRRLIAEQHWEDRKTRKSFRVEYEVHGGEYVK